MSNKKQVKSFFKKTFVYLVVLTTIFEMTGLPALAASPQVASVEVTTTSAKIIFDQAVESDPVNVGPSNSAGYLGNYGLQSPVGTPQVLSRMNPYNHTTEYDDANNALKIYGLNLTQGAGWQMGIQNIKNLGGETMVPYSTSSTVAVSTDPRVDNNTPQYGKVGNSITLSGMNFGNTTSTVDISGQNASVSSWSDTSIVVTVPSLTAGTEAKSVVVRNDSGDFSAARPFYLYSSSYGILTGTIKDVDGTTSVDLAEVQAYKETEPWNRYQGQTQKNGKFSIVAPAGTYNVMYVTPGSGSTGAAPLKSTGKVVTANSATDLGTITFVNKVIFGKVYAPDGTTPLYGARINVHNQNWTAEQEVKTGTDGSYKVYVTPSSTTPEYILEVSPSDYDRNVNDYLSASTSQNVSGAGPYEKNITLSSENVTGTVKTPTGDTTDSNPFPDTVVPQAHVHIFNSNWTFDRWTDTNSNGVFKFGGVPDGTYTLELEAPFCGNPNTDVAKFCVYTRTRIENVSVSGTTNVGIERFNAPNFYGYIYVDTNSNNQYDNGEGLADSWVNMNKDGFWTGGSTDNNGRYAFALPSVTTGRYWINISPPSGYAYYSAEIDMSAITLPYNIKLSVPNFTGYVYGPIDSTGQPNTWLELCPVDTPGTCYSGGSNQQGAFSLNAPNGTWQLRVQPDWNSYYVAPSPKTVVISNNALESVDSDTSSDSDEPVLTNNTVVVRLVDPANDPNGFSGIIYDPAGFVAQQNVGIGLRSAVTEGSSCRGEGMSRWTQTNSQGKYAFSGITEGLYEIEAMPWGQSSYSRVRVCHTVTSESATRTKNINLTAPNITGIVATPAGSQTVENPTPDTAVQGAWVSLFVEGPMGPGGGWYGGNANDQGVFALGGVKPGTYTMEVHPQWESAYSSARYSGVVLSDNNSDGIADDANLNVLIGTVSTNFPNKAIRVGTPNIKGQIVDSDNNPVRWVWVMVHNQNWTQNAGGNTDDNGYFRIGGITQDDTYQIEVNLPWGGFQALVAPSGLSVVITNNVGVIKDAQGNSLTDNKITLTSPTKTITGWVKKSGTTAVANARVEAHRDMGGGFFETNTATDGTYTLNVSGGSWWVETRPDWSGATQADWVSTEPPTRVTFANDSTTESQTLNFNVTASDATITGTVKTPTDTAVQYAWVDVKGNKGMGNGTNTDNNGRFSIKVPAGTYYINVFSSLVDYGSPDQKSVTVVSGGITDAGILYLKSKNSHITGFVQDDAGNPISNVVVNAWLFDGPGWAMTYTDQTGAYDLGVWAGTWGIMVIPMSQNYVYIGAPKKITVTSSKTSAGNNFQLKNANKTLKVKVEKSDGTKVTDIWGGVWVRDTSLGMLDFGGSKEDMMNKAGMTAPAGGPGMEKGGFAGGALNNGYTEIKIPSGTYEVGLGMPPGSRYTLNATQTVVVADTDTSKDVTLLVKENNATISGYFYLDANSNNSYDLGEAVTGIRAFVNADRDGGGWQFTESDSSTGSYSLSVAGGSWYVDAFIDPMMSFGNNQYTVINEDVKTTVADSGSATRNFKLKKLDATITGTVKNPDGTTMTGTDYGLIWVFADFGSADMIEEFKGPGGPGLGTFTNTDGTYSLKVPAGTYKIGAGLPPWDTRDLLNPDLLTVIVAANATSTGNDLQFYQSNATISGNITLSGEKKVGFIRGWSDAGRGAGIASSDGTYSLNVTQGDSWHLVAVAEINNSYYESAETTINVTSTSTTQDLVLVSQNVSIPQGVSSTFDASQSKTIKLTKTDGSDLVILEIPAGSIATSGSITVSITPTVNVKPDAKDKPIGLAYSFKAQDSNMVEIEEFVQNVTIYMYYDPDLIIAAGYSEDSITPKYYDKRTGSWENYSNVVRDTENNKFIIKTDHFSEGGTVGGGGVPSAPSNLTATAQSSSSIALSWTDNSNNETGFKVYRGGTIITTTSANATSYTDTGLSALTTYTYYVQAINTSGSSTASNTAQATTQSTGGGGGITLLLQEKKMPSVEKEAEKEVVALEKPISKMTVAELQSEIIRITALIAKLQTQLVELKAEVPSVCNGVTFDRNLKQGMSGADVKCLQALLNRSSDTQVAATGVGSLENETTYFGVLTKSAVVNFQNKYVAEVLTPLGLTSGTGFVGSKTKVKLNQLLGK